MTVVLDVRVVTGSGGGPDKTLLNSPRFLTGTDYRMLCAYLRPPDDPGFELLRQRARAWKTHLIEIPDRGPVDWRVARELLAVCRREQVTIWHGHDYKSNLLGLLLRPFWPMRLVTTVHGWGELTRRTALYYLVDRLCLPLYERVFCVSKPLLAQCQSFGVSRKRCLLLENGIDTTEFTRVTERAEAKRRLGLPPGRLLIGAVGRLSAEKGFDLLIQAVDRLIDLGHDVALMIAGAGPERSRLEALIAGLDRGDRLHLIGLQANPVPLYEAMDVFALSSHREGLPNVVLEAMALGVPVVATAVGGVPQLIDEDHEGLLIPPGSVHDLVVALDCLLSDATQRDRLGRAGRNKVETRYSFAARMARLRSFYDELLRSGQPSGDPVGVMTCP
jgi:glycosyltransferase involved in cell wall biosynthesis